jgi:hypothetical protein
MSRERTANLAKAGWITLLVYVFANRFVGLVIGRAIADALVFVLAVLAIPLGIYCLTRVRVYGSRGIAGHAVATIVIGVLLLCIWIPNFLAARERAAGGGADDGRQVVRVHVMRDGTIRMNDNVVSVDALKPELERVAAAGGVMRYSRDDPSQDPHPNAMVVMKAATDANVTIEMALPDGQ